MDTPEPAARATVPPSPATPPWRLLLGYLRPCRGGILAGGLLGLLGGLTGLLFPLVTRRLLDDIAAGRSVADLLLLMCGLVLVAAALGPLGEYLLRTAGETIVRTARLRLTSHLLRLRIPALDVSEPGDLIARVTSDATLLRQLATDTLVGAVTGGFLLAGTIALMASLDLVLLGVTMAALVLALGVMRTVMPRVGRASRQVQEAVGATGAALERALGALRTVKAAGAERQEEAAVHASTTASWQASVKAAKWLALGGSFGEVAMQVAFFAVLAVGGARVAAGGISAATLIAFLMYVYYLVPSVHQLLNAASQYQIGTAAITRIAQAQQLPTEPPADPAAAVGGPPVAVEFRDVHFRYRPELAPVHRGISFRLPPGGVTAIVGPSGAGKTTVFSLLERFYEPTAGRILVDGVPLPQWELGALRAAIGYVEQDAPVLAGTLRENLVLGAPAGKRRLLEVLRLTRLEALVGRLPDGLDTLVGHRGTRLSGGERQRLAIARALLRQPRLLLLDEATSQLDAGNELALRDTVADIAATTTVLLVAHRLSTVTLADRIIVFADGGIRAVGSHQELIETDPTYAALAATQFLHTAA